jgi:hypothetical protein
LTFPQVSDDQGDVFARFDVPYQPAMAVVDKHGVVKVSLGAVEEDVLDAALSAAVAG